MEQSIARSPKYIAILALVSSVILIVGWFARPREIPQSPPTLPSENDLMQLARRAERRSLDGMTTGYPTLSDAEADGVFHPGCRHTVAPYVEGLTRADYYQQGDPERYAAEQQQRYLERGLRQWKRREALALDPTQAQLAQNKIGEWRRRLEEHVTKHDLPREREREQISKAI